jgi:chemotaxis protein MotB
MLLQANTQQDLLSKKVVIVQNLLNETNITLHKEKKILNKTLNDYKGKVIVLSDQLTEVNKTVQHKDEKLLLMHLMRRRQNMMGLLKNCRVKKPRSNHLQVSNSKLLLHLKRS